MRLPITISGSSKVSFLIQYLALILPLLTLGIDAVADRPGADHPGVDRPVIALVPGAWHSPIHYSTLIVLLRSKGYQVVTHRNPSCDSDDPNAQSVSSDAAFIRSNLLLPQIDAGKDVILAMHSYGGCPGAVAAKGLSKAELAAKGKKGGIIGLLFICAFLANEGDSLLSKLPGQVFDPWVISYVRTPIIGFSIVAVLTSDRSCCFVGRHWPTRRSRWERCVL